MADPGFARVYHPDDAGAEKPRLVFKFNALSLQVEVCVRSWDGATHLRMKEFVAVSLIDEIRKVDPVFADRVQAEMALAVARHAEVTRRN